MRSIFVAWACAVLLASCQPPEETPQRSVDSASAAVLTPKDAGEAATNEVRMPRPPEPRPCREELGQAAAERLVHRCVMVSPATHPPCNVINPCAMIQGEIDRACDMYGPGETRPEECFA
jgi:hypothetical protein